MEGGSIGRVDSNPPPRGASTPAPPGDSGSGGVLNTAGFERPKWAPADAVETRAETGAAAGMRWASMRLLADRIGGTILVLLQRWHRKRPERQKNSGGFQASAAL